MLDGPIELPFKMSLERGIVPRGWKRADIIAIDKKGDLKRALNYISVSLTSMVCKVVEKIIRRHVDDFLQRRNFLSE